MRVLVTGGCGFIGAACVRALVDRGDRVLNIDRRRRTAAVPALSTITGREGYARLEMDIADRALMRAIFREFKPDVVMHLAAGEGADPDGLFHSDLSGAFAILEACRDHVGRLDTQGRDAFRLIHAIHAPGLESDSGEISIPTPAEASRAAAASLIENWSQAHGLPLVSCVAGNVFGPWQSDDAFLPRLVADLFAGRPVTLTHGGATVRDWLPLKDFASGLIAAFGAEPGSRYEFSVGAERGDIDLSEAICALLDHRAPLDGVTSRVDLIRTVGDAAHASPGPMLDSSSTEHDLGWSPLGFHAGLDRLLSWAADRAVPAVRPAAVTIAIAAE